MFFIGKIFFWLFAENTNFKLQFLLHLPILTKFTDFYQNLLIPTFRKHIVSKLTMLKLGKSVKNVKVWCLIVTILLLCWVQLCLMLLYWVFPCWMLLLLVSLYWLSWHQIYISAKNLISRNWTMYTFYAQTYKH